MTEPRHLFEPPPLNDSVMTKRISDLVTDFVPKMEVSYSLIQSQCQQAWLPRGPLDDATRDFYQQLRIPLFNEKPSLLLHGLEAPTSTFAKTLFNGDKFK